MARRWTPRRFVTLRRVRVAVCVGVVLLASIIFFAITARKSVALTVNGDTKTVTTYSASVPRFLESQGVKTKSHDFIESTDKLAGLKNNDVVTVRSAYQTTINIQGQEVSFWTYATSADQLLGFFKANDQNASKVSVNVGNVYNQLTGGFVINKAGPVTVIADGKTSVAPNGKLTAASILDSKNITIGKDDRVNVSEENGKTILRVQRVTHGQETKNVAVAFPTRTVVDPSLQPGQTQIRQAGQNGNKQQVYDVTYVDGQAESSSLKSEAISQAPVEEIVAVGPAAPAPAPSTGGSGSNSNSGSGSGSDSGSNSNSDSNKGDSNSSSNSNSSTSAPSAPSQQPSQPSQPSTPTPAPTPAPAPAPTPTPTPPASSGGGLWHPTREQAQIYAQGAAAQYGWTGDNWSNLVWIWDHESGWRWNAGNPNSTAYGIPQILYYYLYTSQTDWPDNGATQIAAGLTYINGRYGSPNAARVFWNANHWY
ncbi:G5 domain-containing protein [Bifidobacterium sp. ESL0769]|uniref:aggregation-promoting factor C-terminal-like domain-containing protein n=1 Tax=Bifidobacterium sp. ESL0769 TaxID=2983229 RepID=UPI0023F80F49|nr:G5 domain-containing protein [Bifidobacterium sp. ESL0769]WEV67507.1 G5 domain-containing protein [Bifidobacterium sp. ESL0769]